MDIELKLDEVDAAVLRKVLEAYLSELRFEIADTDSFEFRARLHKQEDRIKSMLATLNGDSSHDGVSASVER